MPAEQWTDVQANLSNYKELLLSCVSIISRMDPRYAKMDVATLQSWLESKQHQNTLCYCSDRGTFEVVLAFANRNGKSQHFIQHVAFWGDPTPDRALEAIVQRAKAYADAHGIGALHAIKPFTMEYLPNKQLLDRVTEHASLSCAVENVWPDALHWRISWVPH